MLARAALESCLVGLYCVYVPDALEHLNANEAKTAKALLAPVAQRAGLGSEVVDILAGQAGLGQSERWFNLKQAVDETVANGGPSIVRSIYESYYRPLSTFYIHSLGAAATRHLGRGEHPTDRPRRVASLKSLREAGDLSVGILAAALAEPGSLMHAELAQYGQDHFGRCLPPLLAYTTMGSWSKVHWELAPGSIRAFRELRRYAASDSARDDSWEDAAAKVHGLVADILRLIDKPPPELSEAFTTALLKIRGPEDIPPQTAASPPRPPG